MFSITVTFKDFTVILLECSLLHLSPIVGYVDFKYCEITCCLLVLQCYYYYFFFFKSICLSCRWPECIP